MSIKKNPDKRLHGILETVKHTRERGLREFAISRPPANVLDRLKKEGHTIRESPQPGKVIVEIRPEPESEMIPEVKDTP